jgi:threonine dehydrogenase-like Zn-dependent dehydrogenase
VGTVVESTVPQFAAGQGVIALPHTGALVECAAVPADLIVPLPDNPHVDLALWVLCQPTCTGMYAMQRIGDVQGKRVVVVGAGPIACASPTCWCATGQRRSSWLTWSAIGWMPRAS